MNRWVTNWREPSSVALPDGGNSPDGAEQSASGRRHDEGRLPPSREMFERITDAFFALDTDFRFTYLNGRAAEIFDVDPEAAVGTHVSDHVPDAVGTTFFEEPHRAMREQEPVTFEEYFDPMDSWFEVRVYPSETGLSVYLRDVTERHEAREEIEEVTETLSAILETSPIGIVVLSSDREARWLNDRAADILDMEREEVAESLQEPLVADTVDEHGNPIEEEELPSNRVLKTGEPVFGQVLGIMLGGERLWISVNAAPLYDEGGIDRVVATFEDVTERREREAQLARQNERLNEFASVVSHDLRNPLGVAMGYLTLAREEGDHEAFDRVRDALERIDHIVDGLLALAREGQSVGETEPVDLAETAERAWTTTETDGAELRVATDATVEADPERLRTLLENLFRNSVEHAGDEVTVTVATLPDESGFFVADDGPGIPEEEREQVFTRGYSGSEGTGFGLAIVREIAEAHDWEISATESEAGGARFEILTE